jgi:hypothetical protein
MSAAFPATAASNAASGTGTAFRSLPSDRVFFTTMSIVAACTIITGFLRTYTKALQTSPALPLFVHVHAAVFVSWLVLFVAQSILVARGRLDLHRRFGVAGAVLAATMLIVGVGTAIASAKIGYRGIPGQEFPNAEGFLLVSLRDITIFSIFVGLGLWRRATPPVHKRSMLVAVLGGLLPPGVARLPFVSSFLPAIGVVLLVFQLAGPAYDFAHYRRVHPVFVWGGLLSMLTIPPMLEPVAMSHAWQAMARFLVG